MVCEKCWDVQNYRKVWKDLSGDAWGEMGTIKVFAEVVTIFLSTISAGYND